MEEKEKNLTQQEEQSVRVSADGTVIIQLYHEDKQVRLTINSYDKLHENKPLTLPPLIVVLSGLQEIVFEMFKNSSAPESRLLKDVNVLNEAFRLILTDMISEVTGKTNVIYRSTH